jgi:hypothetical protein
VGAIEEEEEADQEERSGRERGEPKPKKVERPAIDGAGRVLGRVAREEREESRTRHHRRSLAGAEAARGGLRTEGPRGPAPARRPQSGPTGPPERPIRRLPRRAEGSRLAP